MEASSEVILIRIIHHPVREVQSGCGADVVVHETVGERLLRVPVYDVEDDSDPAFVCGVHQVL